MLIVAGTRPEAIKMAPVILRLRAEPAIFEPLVCATAQHREMLDSVLELFEVRPDFDLDLMKPSQTLNDIAAGMFERFDSVLEDAAPDWVLVQGDTTTVMAAALAAFHRKIKVAHVEAGLRTNDFENPFPEEMNRRITDLIAHAHFAPTPSSREALLREGVPASRVHVTGNTIVDALQWITEHDREPPEPGLDVLITAHRRESFGEPMERSFRAIRRIASAFPEANFIFPVHPNPRVVEAATILENQANVRLVPPADYRQLIRWIRACRIVITDSGGIQEEAATFGKPALVLRETTERPEGIERGVAKLVGTDEDLIWNEGRRLLSDSGAYASMARAGNPYGDGRAAERIADILARRPTSSFDG